MYVYISIYLSRSDLLQARTRTGPILACQLQRIYTHIYFIYLSISDHLEAATMYVYISMLFYSIYLSISDLLEARVRAGPILACQLQCIYTYQFYSIYLSISDLLEAATMYIYISIYLYLTFLKLAVLACQLQYMYIYTSILSINLYLTFLKLASAPVQSLPASYDVDIHLYSISIYLYLPFLKLLQYIYTYLFYLSIYI